MSSTALRRGRADKDRGAGFVASRSEIEALREKLRALSETGLAVVASEEAAVDLRLGASTDNLAKLADDADLPWAQLSWSSERWEQWVPAASDPKLELRLGTFVEDRTGQILSIPIVIRFCDSPGALMIVSSRSEEHLVAEAFLHSVVARLAVGLGGNSKFSFIDKARKESTFERWRRLPGAQVLTDDVCEHLEFLLKISRRTVGSVDAGRSKQRQFADEAQIDDHHFVVVGSRADLDAESVDALRALATVGPSANVHVLFHIRTGVDTTESVNPLGLHADLISRWTGATVVDVAAVAVTAGGLAGSILLDDEPSGDLTELLIDRIVECTSRRPESTWDDISGLAEVDWWQESSPALTVPVGLDRTGETIDLSFDFEGGRGGGHLVYSANSPADRSALLAGLLLGLAIRNSPDELQLYLIGGDSITDVATYAELPHSAAISVDDSSGALANLLTELTATSSRRTQLLISTNLVDIASYRRAGSPLGAMPTLLLAVDDYLAVLDSDTDGTVTDQLLHLIDQGRFTGIHVLLGSPAGSNQAYSVSAELDRRVDTRLVIRPMTIPIEPARSGSPTSSQPDKAGPNRQRVTLAVHAPNGPLTHGGSSLLSAEERDDLIARIARRASIHGWSARPSLIGGGQPARLAANPSIRRLLAHGSWPTPEHFGAVGQIGAPARSAKRGTELAGEFVGSLPVPLFIGDSPEDDRRASVVLHRQAGSSVLIVGSDPHARVGMTAAAVVSAAIVARPGTLWLWVCDRSAAGGRWSHTLCRTLELLDAVVDNTRFSSSDVESADLILQACALVQQRLVDPEAAGDCPTLLVVVQEVDRLSLLLRSREVDRCSHPAIATILSDGPSVGVHLIATAPTLNRAFAVLDDLNLAKIRFRIAMRMPESESSGLVGSGGASHLQIAMDGRDEAIVFDVNHRVQRLIEPYSTLHLASETGPSLIDEDIGWIAASLALRPARSAGAGEAIHPLAKPVARPIAT